MTTHKSGFVNIIGNPNVGKSTLMNLLVGERLSIITNKSQTTRHRIHGIISGENYQIVFSDTPGIIKPKYKLQESMMDFVSNALLDADVILYITDVVEDKAKNTDYLEKIKASNIPVIIALNKIDLVKNNDDLLPHIDFLGQQFPTSPIFPVSAKNQFNTQQVFNEILTQLPESPPYYPKETLTDRPERFFVSEIIREKILEIYAQEIPYSVEIKIEQFIEEEHINKINAVIYVTRDSQKAIIIGKGGRSIKKLGVDARKDIEVFLQKKVYLELFVKVNKDWRNNEKALKSFGY